MDPSATFLANKRIAFTGRFASLGRVSAINLLTDRGGLFRRRVTLRTDFLVIGADGWPLRSSGALTRNLLRANQLKESGHAIEIIGEAEFIRRFDALEYCPPVRTQHTIEQLSRLLGVSGQRIRHWVQLGLLHASAESGFSPTFDFQAVAAAKLIWQMIRAGVRPSKLAKNLRTLQRWLPDDPSLGRSIIAIERRLLVRTDLGQLIDRYGQMHFAFDDVAEVNLSFRKDETMDPDKLFDTAFLSEKSGHFEEAIRQYRLWITNFGADADVQFNLANVLAQIGQLEDAIEMYREVLKTSPEHSSAWNNLGLCEYRAGECLSAIQSLQRAAALNPLNIDTLYNLADALDETGNHSKANALLTQIAQSSTEDEIVDYAQERVLRREGFNA